MAVAYVRDSGLKLAANFDGTYAQTGSFASLPAVGNHVIVTVAHYHYGAPGINTVTDNQGNTYAEDKEQVLDLATDEAAATIDSCKVATSSGTYTLSINPTNDTSGNYLAWCATEFSGIAATNWLDQTGNNNNAAGDANVTASGANATTAGIAIGVASISNNDSDINIGDTPPTGYTNIQVNEDASSYVGLSSVYKIYSAPETSGASWTHDNTSQTGWAAVIATYKAATAAATLFRRTETDRAGSRS